MSKFGDDVVFEYDFKTPRTISETQAAAKLGTKVVSLDEMWDLVGGKP